METLLRYVQQILSTPAIFVGLIAMLGLILKKADSQAIIKGTIKTILGFIVLGAGAGVVQQSIVPFGDLFQLAFDMHGVVPNNEAIVSMGLTEYAVQTSSIFALGMCMNIVLARFSRWKYIFLTGHHALYMACLITIMLDIAGLEGWQLTVGGALLLGFVMAMFPALMQPTMIKITGDDNLALGHFGSSCYFISAQIGKLFAGGKSSEEVNFPKGLSFLRDNTISIAIVMFFCYIVVAGVAEFGNSEEAAKIWGDSNRIVFSVLQAITFSAGIYVVLAGVRLLIAEIVPAFKGISEELIPNSKPAIDCPSNFAKAFGGSILFGLIVVLFAAPIVYNFVAPKPKKASEEVAEQG